MHWPMTRPSSTSRAANNVVVPWLYHRGSSSRNGPRFIGKPGLGCGRAPGLRLLVDRQHQRVLGRVDIEARRHPEPCAKLRSRSTSLKLRTRCGFSPCAAQVRCTAAMADPGGLSPSPAGPVRRLARRFGQPSIGQPARHRCRQRRLAPRGRWPRAAKRIGRSA